MSWFSRTARHLVIDVAPLQRSRDLRCLVAGQLVAEMGSQLTMVAVPYQVYLLTHSSFDVGLASLAQLLPLLVGSLFGGSLADVLERRRLMLVTLMLMAGCSAGLAVNTDLGASLWPLFVLPALAAGFSSVGDAARSAMVPSMVRLAEVPTANAMFQVLTQFGTVAGPALAGVLLAGAGVKFVYWMDVVTLGAAGVSMLLIAPQPPVAGGSSATLASSAGGSSATLASSADEASHPPGLRSIMEGFSFVRRQQAIQGAYLIDLNAMVFGMPRALFPALAVTVFGGGASTLGFLYAAPGAGALIAALTTGWVGRIQRQGRAVIVAVIVWGAAIACFGLVHWLPLALVLLAVAGGADVISAVFRNTIIQLAVPDALRGRLMGVQIGVVTGGPRIGDLEAGAVANAFGVTTSVVSGGLACVAGAVALARLLPGFSRQRTAATAEVEVGSEVEAEAEAGSEAGSASADPDAAAHGTGPCGR